MFQGSSDDGNATLKLHFLKTLSKEEVTEEVNTEGTEATEGAEGATRYGPLGSLPNPPFLLGSYLRCVIV